MSNPPWEVDWKRIQTGFYYYSWDSHEVMLTMRSLACLLAWLVMDCGTCCITIFCSALATMLEKKEACFLVAEKSGTIRFKSTYLLCHMNTIQYTFNSKPIWRSEIIVIGVSLSESHIDRDNSPHMYVSNILTCVCHTLVPEIRVRPEIFRVFWCYWCAHVHDLQLNSRDLDRATGATRVCREK